MPIANNTVNAVAMTVLPDAPIDHCLVGSTLVSMADGSYKRIDEVVVGDLVNTLEGVSTVKRWLDQGIKNTITLTFDNGTTLTCTPDHQIRTTIGWIEAQYLTEEHEIIHE